MTKLRRANSRKTTRLDLHVHTRGSDGFGSPEDIVGKAIERGLDGLVICDHHHTVTAEGSKVIELGQRQGLIMLRGCEYSTKQGHCLVYGVDVDKLNLGRYPEMAAVIAAAKRAGGVAFPSHPYYGYRERCGDHVFQLGTGLKAIEVINGQNEVRAPTSNLQAEQAAGELGIQGVGGSDAHSPDQVGLAYTTFPGLIGTERQLTRALRKGGFRACRNQRVIDGVRLVRNRVFPENKQLAVPLFRAAPTKLDKTPMVGDLTKYEPEEIETARAAQTWSLY
jgi:hypothetical protein